jgi:hypothetical protein
MYRGGSHHHHHRNYYKFPDLQKSLLAAEEANNIQSEVHPTNSVDNNVDDIKKWQKVQEKRYRSALEDSIKFNPYNHEVRTALAKALAFTRNRGYLSEAQQHAKIILKTVPSCSDAYFVQGLSQIHDYPEKSILSFDKALLYDSTNRGKVHVSREQAHAHLIKHRRDFVSNKIREKTAPRLVERLHYKIHHSKMSCLLKETDIFLRVHKEQEKRYQLDFTEHRNTHGGVGKQQQIKREPHDGRHGLLPVYWGVFSSLGEMKDTLVSDGSDGGIVEYYESGAHARDIKSMLTKTKKWLTRKLLEFDRERKERGKEDATITKSKKSRFRKKRHAAAATARKKNINGPFSPLLPDTINYIFIDVDDTAFNGYHYMKKRQFKCLPPQQYSEYLLDKNHVVNKAVVNFVNWIHETDNLKCVFVTERPIFSKQSTIDALHNGGYEHYDDILWCATAYHKVGHEDDVSHASSAGGMEAKVVEKKESGETGSSAPIKSDITPNDEKIVSNKSNSSSLSHHPHYHYAGKALQKLKERTIRQFLSDESQGVRRRLIAIVGDQDCDFLTEDDNGETPLCIKIPNFLYTLE